MNNHQIGTFSNGEERKALESIATWPKLLVMVRLGRWHPFPQTQEMLQLLEHNTFGACHYRQFTW